MNKVSIEQQLREAFEFQAHHCRNLDSPFMARLCDLLIEKFYAEPATKNLLSAWPKNLAFIDSAFVLRFAGALHSLVIKGVDQRLARAFPADDSVGNERLWDAIVNAVETHSDYIREFIQSPPQTNEVRRAASLLPGFLAVSHLTHLPLSLYEIGSSAGLNLHWDEFYYQFNNFAWGNPQSPVKIKSYWQGRPLKVNKVEVTSRSSCDISPLNVNAAEDEIRLLSYVWADQRERLERVRAAIQFAKEKNVQVDKEDALAWLKKSISATKNNTVRVVYHTIVWQYLTKATQQGIEKLLKKVGGKATVSSPLAWLRIEPDGEEPGARIALTLWPSGKTYYLGRADFHGRWVEWRGLE